MRTIQYHYDDDDSVSLYDTNPLIKVTYPSGDSICYAYVDSAFYVYDDDTTYYNTGAYRLSEVILPNGGKVNYDWEIFREYRDNDPYDNAYYWHVNVTSIQLTDIDNTVDIIDYYFDYAVGNIGFGLGRTYDSYVKYPDSSGIVYSHSPIKPCAVDDDQISGLLMAKLYFNKIIENPFDSIPYYGVISGDNWVTTPGDGYESYIIGQDLESDTIYIKAPFQTNYKIVYGCNGVLGDCAYSSDFENFNINTTTGLTLGHKDIDNGIKTIKSLSYSGSGSNANRTCISSIITIDSLYEDTLITQNFWDMDDMVIESVYKMTVDDTVKTEYEYNNRCELIKRIKPLGDTLQYQYADSFVNPILVYTSDFDLSSTKYNFYTNKPEYIINSNSDTTFYSYEDSTNRLKEVKLPGEDDFSRHITYDDVNNIVIDSMKLDSQTYQTSLTYSNGFGTVCSTKVTAQDQPNDSIWVINELDWSGRIKRASRPFASISDTVWTEYEYNIMGEIASIVDPLGNEVSYKDSAITDYLLKITTDQLGFRTINVYNEASQLVETWSGALLQDIVKYEYDAFGRRTKITDPRGLETKYWYDHYGNLDSMYSVDEGMYWYYHDDNNRLRFKRSSVEDDEWIYLKYDKYGRLVEEGKHSDILTDSVNVIDYPRSSDTLKTIVASYEFDTYGDVSFLSVINRLAAVEDDSGKRLFYYDDRGNIIQRKIKLDGLTDTLNIYYDYDAGNRLVTLTYPDSNQVSYDYYDSDRVRDIPGFFDVDGIAAQSSFQYEPWGALSEITYIDTCFTTSYEYNSLSMPTKMFTRYASFQKWGRNYNYNALGLIDAVEALDDSGTVSDTILTYTYDYLYRLSEADYGDATIEYGYDKSGNLREKFVTPGDSIVYYLYYDSTLYYVDSSLVIRCDEISTDTTTSFFPGNTIDTVYWEYDSYASMPQSYFKIESEDSVYVHEYQSDTIQSGYFIPVSINEIEITNYCRCTDECSNSVTVDFKVVDTSATDYDYTNQISYTKVNQTSTVPGSYIWDNKGCLIEGGAGYYQYYFDESNHLDSVYIDDVKRFEFVYDSGGRRVKKVEYTSYFCGGPDDCMQAGSVCDSIPVGDCDYVPGDANNDGYLLGSDVTYLTNYFRGLNEIDDPYSRADANNDGLVAGGDITYLVNYFRGTVSAPACCYWNCPDSVITYYIYSGDQVIAEYDEDGDLIDNYLYMGGKRMACFNTTEEHKEYYIYDVRGSVVMTVDSTGGTVSAMDYYPYGSVSEQSGDSRIKYTGKELDDGYGFDLYYYGARYYNSEWGRFISPDPKREFYNQYSYCWDNPVNVIDRDGRGGSGIDAKVPVLTSWGYDDPIAAWDLDINLALQDALEEQVWLAETEMSENAEQQEEEPEDTEETVILDEYGRTPVEQTGDVIIGVAFVAIPFTPFIEIPVVNLLVGTVGYQFGYHGVPRLRSILNDPNNRIRIIPPWSPEWNRRGSH